MPPARWCEFCIRGKGNEDAHRLRLPDQRLKGNPVVATDYMPLRGKDPEGAEGILRYVCEHVRGGHLHMFYASMTSAWYQAPRCQLRP